MGKHLDDVEDGTKISIGLAERLLRIRDRSGGESALKPNAAQLLFEERRQTHNIVVKARQMGLTTWIAGRFFLKTITRPGTLTVQVAQTREAANSIFRVVQRFWECLPEEMRKGCLRRSRANVGQMVFSELDSEFRVLSAADVGAGRGLTIQNLHLSEVAHWPGDAAGTLAGLRAALAPGGELTLESTPNGAAGCFYNEWLQAPQRGMAQHFIPWWKEPAYVSAAVTDLRDDERELVARHGLTPEQIGFRRGLEITYRGLRAQEFAEDESLCFRSSGECCFDAGVLEELLERAPEPCELRRGGQLRIWMPPQPGVEYLLAVDPAGGGASGDYTAMQCIDLMTGMQCAELQQHLAPRETARTAAALAAEYGTAHRPALIVVERNNHGHGVLAHLQSEERATRVYESRGARGFETNAASRPRMIGGLDALLASSTWLFHSRWLVEECRTFVNQRNGSSGAAGGAHDDLVMAMAMAHAVREELLQRGAARRAG